jgi:hypothetical protein
MTSNEMRRASHKPGYWFENVAALGEKPVWRERAATPAGSGFLFGYAPAALLAKQYRH